MDMEKLSGARKLYDKTLRCLLYLCAFLTCALLVFMIGYIFYRGLPHVTWNLISTKPSYLSDNIGILPDILVTVIEFATETLTGIPSIIYGLVGMLIFTPLLGKSLLAGALTLVIMTLPTIVRTTQESLKTVPASYREGALGLGSGKWHMIRTIVLPCSIDGIVTGCILAIGRIVGESAALLFTAGFAHALNGFFTGLTSSGATLTVALYVYAKEQGEFEVAFAIAAILMILTLIINLSANFVGKKLKRRQG